MNNIAQTILQIIISILSIIGSLTCFHYIFEKIVNNKSNKLNQEEKLLKKDDNVACLILNVDKIGDKLEYYIRKTQDDIKNKRCIYISKIILYSEKLENSQFQNEEKSYQEEITRMCELFTFDYTNVIFVKGNFMDNVFA